MPTRKSDVYRATVNIGTLFDRMPFGDFAVREPFSFDHPKTGRIEGVETTVVSRRAEDRTLTIITETRVLVDGLAKHMEYGPYQDTTDARDWDPNVVVVWELFSALYERTHRFLESIVSRQQRRAAGRPKEYREYIVVPRDDTRYEGAARGSAIAKRLRELHSVRGHPRTYKASGKTIWVASHLRGKGDLVQAKDYVVTENGLSAVR